jgi:hypothetical protein
MPYTLTHKDGKWAVKTITTGKLHGWTTKSKAEAQFRLLESLIRNEK